MMLLLVAMLVGMTSASVSESEDETIRSHGDPLWEQERDSLLEEFPNQGDSVEDVDHTDILNFDPVTRTMRNRKPKTGVTLLEECQTDLVQCRHNLADFHEKILIDAMYDKNEAHNKVGTCTKKMKTCHDDLADCKLGCHVNVPVSPDDGTESPCKLEQMFFRRFAKRFVNLLIAEYKDGDDSPLAADVRVELGSYGWNKLRQFVQQKGKVKLVDAHDLMADMLITTRHDNDTGSTSWLERLTGMDASNIQFYVLLFGLSVAVFIFESRTRATWWQQLCAVMFVLFLISVGWNWIFLYKKELAHKISKMEKKLSVPANCNPDKMTWVDSIREVFRKQMTFQSDPCDEYHEMILVDPIYEVPPTRAISHTVSIMFMEPLKPLGKYMADFHRELLQDLPYAAWLPALVTVYLIPVCLIMVMCYCPRPGRGGRRRDNAAWEQVRILEDRLKERDAIDRRRDRIDALENPPKEAYAAMQQAPLPVQDNRYLRDVPAARHQRQPYPDDPAAGERPQPRGRRRQRGSSESDLLQHRQQRPSFVRDLGTRRAQSAPYHGDVSGGDDSSDETDGLHGQRPRALHLEEALGPSSQVSPSRVGAPIVTPEAKFRSQTTDIQGQPIECPNSEVDSMELHTTARIPSKALSQGQTVKDGQMVPKGDRPQGISGKRGEVRGAEIEDEAKIRKAKSGDTAEAVSASVTPASSTDSEPFVTSALGFDSPSSVSVIEGDSSPASGGSVDGDTHLHLQGLGMSLSGSIDVIEPLGALGGTGGDNSEDGQDSDEFEVLSREQCQKEYME